jgi:hypothetical protein
MSESSNAYTSAHAVDALVRYIEYFGDREFSLQKLLECGYTYREIIEMIDNAIAEHRPIYSPPHSEECGC